MANYKKGDVIVKVGGELAIGEEFVCNGFTACSCGDLLVILERDIMPDKKGSYCKTCKDESSTPAFCAYNFIKKPSFGALTEYKTQVSIRETLPELVELKNLEN